MRHRFLFLSPLTPTLTFDQSGQRGSERALFFAGSKYQRLAKKLIQYLLICFSFFPFTSEASEALRTPAGYNAFAKGRTLYVKQGSHGNGKSFVNALGDLQDALRMAKRGDQVWVAAGTYYPTETSNRDISFVIPDGVAIYGGFLGTETVLDQRDSKKYLTILSGDIGQRKRVDDNSYSVIYTEALENTTLLDGFIITQGYADAPATSTKKYYCGGGWFNHSTTEKNELVIRNCTFKNNFAFDGGALYNEAKSGVCTPQIENCQFLGNRATNEGGAVYNDGERAICEPTFIQCRFEKNEAPSGGAILNYGSATKMRAKVEDCQFHENVAYYQGNATYNRAPRSTKTQGTAKSPVNRAKSYALFFAASEYQDDQLTNLPQTLENAKKIASILKKKYGFETEIITNPTLDDIEEKLTDYQQAFQSGEFDQEGQLLIFFAGHGVKEFNNGYFLPTDADPDRVLRTGLAYNTWRPFITQVNCKHILVAVDACYSVTFDPNWQTMSGKPDFGRPGGELTDQELLLTNHANYPSRLFLTSDAKEDVVPGRSDFTRKLLEGLIDFNSPILTARELFAKWIKKANPTPNADHFEKDDARSSFLFISKDFRRSGNGMNRVDLRRQDTQSDPPISKTVRVKLIVNANYSKASFTLDDQALYPIANTPVVKEFEIEYYGKPRKLKVIANDRTCTKMIVVPSNYTADSPPIQLTCSQ